MTHKKNSRKTGKQPAAGTDKLERTLHEASRRRQERDADAAAGVGADIRGGGKACNGEE